MAVFESSFFRIFSSGCYLQFYIPDFQQAAQDPGPGLSADKRLAPYVRFTFSLLAVYFQLTSKWVDPWLKHGLSEVYPRYKFKAPCPSLPKWELNNSTYNNLA
jgi:hypothetical protein